MRSIARLIRRFLSRIRPTSSVTAGMRKDWDERARRNARYYVATLKEDWTDQDFFESGRIWVEWYVMPYLPLIGGTHPPSDLRMLEIGCGAGRMTRTFAGLFGSVDAADISREMISEAKGALAHAANVHFYVIDGTTLSPLPGDTYDFVFCALVFQHIPRKSVVRNYIREVARVLRPGGVFRFQAQGGAIRESDADSWLGAGFSEEEMRGIAAEYGFAVHDITGAGTQDFWLTFLKGRIPQPRA